MDGIGVVGTAVTNSNGIATYTYNGAFVLSTHDYSAVPTPATQQLP